MEKNYIKYMVIASVLMSSFYAINIRAQSNNVINKDCIDMSSPLRRTIVNNFILQSFNPPLKRLGNNENYLVKRFGKYRRISKNIYIPYYRDPNEKPYEVLKEDWDFNGIVLTVHSLFPKPPKNKNPYWITKILISKNKYSLKQPIKIGSTVDEIQCYLGRSSSDDDIRELKKIVYSTGGEGEWGDLTIYLDSNYVAEKIVFEYFTD